MQQGYATSSTDTGHQGNGTDGEWALGNYERIVNFADRGTHLMAEADKVILKAFYGAEPAHSYFSGCSQGGHEAMIEAQRYPADFDGIIAGDPANNWTHHYIGGHLWVALAMDGDGYIPANKVHILADAVNDQCDALDGIKDGVLNDPRRCKFNPETLLCKGSDTSECLTGAQVAAVQKLWAGLRTAEGQVIYPGLVPGGEAGPGGWAGYITGNAPGKGRHTTLGVPFFKFMVFDDPNWDYKTFKFNATDGFDSDIDYTDSKLGGVVQCGESGSQRVQSSRRQADSLSRLERPGHYAAQQHQLLRERDEGAGRRCARITQHGGVLPALHGAGDAALPGRTGGHELST